jgi:hypothetical protein
MGGVAGIAGAGGLGSAGTSGGTSSGGTSSGGAGAGGAGGSGPTTPELRVTFAGTEVSCAGNVETLPSQTVGASAAALGIRIENVGSAPLGLTGNAPVELVSADPGEFLLTGAPTTSLQPSEFVDVTLEFSPHWTGTRYASLLIPNDDADEGSCSIRLEGFGSPLGTQLGNWSSTTSMIDSRYNPGVAVSRGRVYVTGGCRARFGGTDVDTAVEFAVLSAGALGSWTAATELAGPICDHASFAYNDHLFTVGGGIDEDRTPTDSVRLAPIASDGSLGAWVDTTAVPIPWRGGVAVVHRDFVYLVGGRPANAIWYSQISADGSLGAWQSGPALLFPRVDMGAAVVDGYLHVFGGFNSGAGVTQSERAQLNLDGTLEAFVETTDLGQVRSSAAGVAYSNSLLILGGDDGSNTTFSSGLSSAVNVDAELGSWSSLADNFSTNRTGLGAFTYDGSVFVLGGWNSLLSNYRDVQVANFE